MKPPTLALAALLTIATASAFLPSATAAIVMSTAAVCIASVSTRWLREDYATRQWVRKIESDEREQAALRAWNKHKAEETQ